MKKLFSYMLLITVMALFMTSCSSSGPGSAFKSYMEKMKTGDYKGCAQGFAVDETKTPEQNAKATEMIESILTDKADKAIKEKGGLKDVEVLEESISEDGNTATLKVKFTYGDGSEQENTQDMIKQNGEWKMVFKK